MDKEKILLEYQRVIARLRDITKLIEEDFRTELYDSEHNILLVRLRQLEKMIDT